MNDEAQRFPQGYLAGRFSRGYTRAGYQRLEQQDGTGGWEAESTFASGWDWRNGNRVGGATNFMSGFFHRMKPDDFRLLSALGPAEWANLVDRLIGYEDPGAGSRRIPQGAGAIRQPGTSGLVFLLRSRERRAP